MLFMDDFALPPTQDISLVRENDTLVIKKIAKRAREASSSEADTESSSEEEKKPTQQNKKQKKAPVVAKPQPKPAVVAAPAKPALPAKPATKSTTATTTPTTKKVTTKPAASSSSSSSSESESSSGYSSSSESEEEEHEKKKNKVVKPAQTKQPAKAQAPTPKTKPQETSQTKPAVANQQSPAPSPAKKSTVISPAPKGHFKFDQEGSIVDMSNQQEAAPVKDTTATKAPTLGKGRGKVERPHTGRNKKDKDKAHNVSMVFQNPAVVMPVRDYNSFPLLKDDEDPQIGDHLSFYLTELVGWHPQRNLKEATVMSYDPSTKMFVLRIHEAFLTKPEPHHGEAAMEDTEEEEQPSDIMNLERSELAEIRIISRKQQ